MKKSEENIEENKVREIIEDFFKEIHVNMENIKNKELFKDSVNLDNFVKDNHKIEVQKIGDFLRIVYASNNIIYHSIILLQAFSS